jgi:hypothetical protein
MPFFSSSHASSDCNAVSAHLISEPAPRVLEQESFTPLAARVGLALVEGMGIDPSRVIDCSLHTDSGPVAKLVVAFHVLPADLERVLRALAAIPTGSEQ